MKLLKNVAQISQDLNKLAATAKKDTKRALKGTGDKPENPCEDDSDWVESDDERVALRPEKRINYIICYPCGAGSGTPADNIYFKNVRSCLS